MPLHHLKMFLKRFKQVYPFDVTLGDNFIDFFNSDPPTGEGQGGHFMSRLGENVEFTLCYGNFHTLNVWLITFHQFLRSNCIFSPYLDLLSWFRIIITALKAHFRGSNLFFWGHFSK